MENVLFCGLTVALLPMCILHTVDAIKLAFVDKAIKYKSLSAVYAIFIVVMLGFYIYAMNVNKNLSPLALAGILIGATSITSRYNISTTK